MEGKRSFADIKVKSMPSCVVVCGDALTWNCVAFLLSEMTFWLTR